MASKILGKLKGIIASAKEDSRNKRHYTENFWDSIFSSDLFMEGIKNKMYFGELWHPDDEQEYTQIHPGDRSAVVLVDVEKKDKDYYGYFDILPTRAGEVLKNLVDIGCIFGASSRGLSDYDTDYFDDPSIYDLITFDIVAFPGIKSARLYPIEATAISENIVFSKNKVKAMELLSNAMKKDDSLSSYIKNVLKQKENFDTDLQIEDYAAYFDGNPEEILPIIYVDDNFMARANDNIHGEAKVFSYPKSIKLNPGDKYVVDDIYWNDTLHCYITSGEWVKIN